VTLQKKLFRQNHWLPQTVSGLLLVWMFAVVPGSATAAGVSTDASAEGPAQTAYVPAKATGPAVIVISGQGGPVRYQTYAAELARVGYYSVLLDGNDILTRTQDGAANLKKAIERAQKSPSALAGKVAVVGFSLGGGAALRHAARMPEVVSVVVAYYPSTRAFTDMPAFVKAFRVPVLVLAGARDQYKDCCLIDSMHAMAAVAKENALQFELVVYPQADHGFNLQDSRLYRGGDERDAWRRTLDMLRLHQPLPGDRASNMMLAVRPFSP